MTNNFINTFNLQTYFPSAKKLQMIRNIHIFMQDAHHLNFFFADQTIKNNMFSNTIFIIALANIITFAPFARGFGDNIKYFINLS